MESVKREGILSDSKLTSVEEDSEHAGRCTRPSNQARERLASIGSSVSGPILAKPNKIRLDQTKIIVKMRFGDSVSPSPSF